MRKFVLRLALLAVHNCLVPGCVDFPDGMGGDHDRSGQ
jgi:hypothetical protein